ncbi:MAG: type II secretion system protein, partial [bacterium]|nr:type II secretion system protein [bacterium]
KGFTLIELLVVVAIIAILSAVVIANLGDARKRSRDGKKIADVKQIQLALELYFNKYGEYPKNSEVITDNKLVTDGFLPKLPQPTPSTNYVYAGLGTVEGKCTSYHLAAILEIAGQSSLNDDVDAVSTGSNGCSGDVDFHGNATNCSGSSAASTDSCYDVKP